jgi:hypothetical protein
MFFQTQRVRARTRARERAREKDPEKHSQHSQHSPSLGNPPGSAGECWTKNIHGDPPTFTTKLIEPHWLDGVP